MSKIITDPADVIAGHRYRLTKGDQHAEFEVEVNDGVPRLGLSLIGTWFFVGWTVEDVTPEPEYKDGDIAFVWAEGYEPRMIREFWNGGWRRHRRADALEAAITRVELVRTLGPDQIAVDVPDMDDFDPSWLESEADRVKYLQTYDLIRQVADALEARES